MKLKGSQILLEMLKEEKVDLIFGYPGGAVLDMGNPFNINCATKPRSAVVDKNAMPPVGHAASLNIQFVETGCTPGPGCNAF